MADFASTFNNVYSNLPSFSDYFNKMKTGRQAFNTGQKEETGGFLNRYSSAIGGQETSANMARRLGQELNLPALNQNAYDLQATLRGIPTVQTTANRGFDVNENQRQRIVAAKQAEIAPLAQEASAQAQNAQGQLNTLMGYNLNDQEKALRPFTMEQSFLSDRLARETTGFNQDAENEFNSLLQKMATGATLTNAELQRAQDLATFEKNYQLERDKMASDERASALTAAANFWRTM